MQSAPRTVLRTTLRNAPRSQSSQSSPFSSSPSASATFSPHSSQSSSPFSTVSSSTPYAPYLHYPTSFVRGNEPNSSTSVGQACFSTSTRQLASEAPQNPFNDDKFAEHAPLFERIAKSPEILEAIEHMAKVTHEKTGVDLQGGEKPTMMMMLKLARDPDLRAAAERLMAALKSSGVEVDPRQAFQALQMMGGKGFEDIKGDLEDLHEKVRKGEGNEEGEGEKK
ncbi:hypothetical protein JCM11641_002836 [Rhodosporidiobolus odoratus]